MSINTIMTRIKILRVGAKDFTTFTFFFFCCDLSIKHGNRDVQEKRPGLILLPAQVSLLGAHGHLQHPAFKCPHAHSLHGHHLIVTPASLLETVCAPWHFNSKRDHTPCRDDGAIIAAGLAMNPRYLATKEGSLHLGGSSQPAAVPSD